MQPAMPPDQIQALVLQTVQQVLSSPDVWVINRLSQRYNRINHRHL